MSTITGIEKWMLALFLAGCGGSDFELEESSGGADAESGGAAGASGASSGGSAGTSVGDAGVGGGNGATGGEGGGGRVSACADLESSYAKALALAKSCSVMRAGEPCNNSMPDELACPCPTFVDSNNAMALGDMETLIASWNASDCDEGAICPRTTCAALVGATCAPSVGSGPGVCTDTL